MLLLLVGLLHASAKVRSKMFQQFLIVARMNKNLPFELFFA
jgi:hypothetical protein